MLHIVTSSAPRSISCYGETRPIVVFTDGAAEGHDRRDVTVGAVLVDTAHATPRSEMWGAPVPLRLIYFWQLGKNVQVIGRAELLPALLVRAANSERFRHRRVIYCLDNESARQALIKGYSQAAGSRSRLRMMVTLEIGSQCWSWFTRVPSKSNPADNPSRLHLVPGPDNMFATVCEMPTIPEEIYYP